MLFLSNDITVLIMFSNLTDHFISIAKNLSGRGALSEKNIFTATEKVKEALLDADVGFDIVQKFVKDVSDKAQGKGVVGSLTPSETFIGLVRDELIDLMGRGGRDLNLASRPPAVILVAGLQGVGKTTTVAKLGRYLIHKKGKKVGLVSCDIYRPAAIEQLTLLGQRAGMEILNGPDLGSVENRASNALIDAKKKFLDVFVH